MRREEVISMSTIEATSKTALPVSSDSAPQSKTLHVFLTRGIIAIAWAAVFATASHSLTTGVTVGVGVLLVLYPMIDAVASLIDARSQHGSARKLLLTNAGCSTIAAVALGVAATGNVADVATVFGVWAFVSGAAQLVTAIRRRALLGNQWPMRLAGGVSIVFGIAYILAAAGGQPKLSMVTVYAATGGIDFVIQAWLLARRRRRSGFRSK
jgi:uncharacterized membrane protein HdeD (DUF308 family)